MKRLCLLSMFALLVFLTQRCVGAESCRICISAPLPAAKPLSYPPEVYDMTDEEFFQWATEQNDKERAAWEEWFKTAPPRWISYDAFSTNSWHDGVQPGYRGSRGYGERHTTTTRYQRQFLNPDYVSRPLTIINPYCKPTKPQPSLHTIRN